MFDRHRVLPSPRFSKIIFFSLPPPSQLLLKLYTQIEFFFSSHSPPPRSNFTGALVEKIVPFFQLKLVFREKMEGEHTHTHILDFILYGGKCS